MNGLSARSYVIEITSWHRFLNEILHESIHKIPARTWRKSARQRRVSLPTWIWCRVVSFFRRILLMFRWILDRVDIRRHSRKLSPHASCSMPLASDLAFPFYREAKWHVHRTKKLTGWKTYTQLTRSLRIRDAFDAAVLCDECRISCEDRRFSPSLPNHCLIHSTSMPSASIRMRFLQRRQTTLTHRQCFISLLNFIEFLLVTGTFFKRCIRMVLFDFLQVRFTNDGLIITARIDVEDSAQTNRSDSS